VIGRVYDIHVHVYMKPVSSLCKYIISGITSNMLLIHTTLVHKLLLFIVTSLHRTKQFSAWLLWYWVVSQPSSPSHTINPSCIKPHTSNMEVARSFKLPHHTSLSRTLSEALKLRKI